MDLEEEEDEEEEEVVEEEEEEEGEEEEVKEQEEGYLFLSWSRERRWRRILVETQVVSDSCLHWAICLMIMAAPITLI